MTAAPARLTVTDRSRPLLLPLTGWLLILANFFWFGGKALYAHFAPDEMMNMGWAWEAGSVKILLALLQFWSGFYRPTGALYYWCLYQLCGLHPVPFRAVDLAVLVLNLTLVYRFARILSGSAFVAWLCTFLFSYHVSISISTVFNGAFAYDRLCCTFYLAAFLVYVEGRRRHQRPSIKRGAAIVALYILALGSKEMAVTLPVLMLIYEVLWHSQELKMDGIAIWCTRDLRLIAVLALLTLAFVIGKTQGPNAMTISPAYRPTDISISHFLDSQSHYMNELRFRQDRQEPRPSALFVFAAMFVLAAAFRDRCASYSALHALIAPLPIAFLDRGGGCLYIVYIGWALFAASIIYCLGCRLAARMRLGGDLRWIPAAVLASMCVVALLKANHRHQPFMEALILANGDLTWSAIRQLEELHPAVRKGARIGYINSPFQGWDQAFITELWCHDRTVQITLLQKTPLPPEEVAKFDVLLEYDVNGRLRQVRPGG